MDIVLIFNGLGNQMSQYAFYMSKKKFVPQSKCMYYKGASNNHNGSELDKLFDIKYSETFFCKLILLLFKLYENIPRLRKYFHILGINIVSEPQNYDYNESILKKKTRFGITLYKGGWHSEKYFLANKQDVLNTFSFKIAKEDKNFIDLAKSIEEDTNSVSLHVRRGDYLNISPTDHYQFGGVATTNYYKNAVSYMLKRNKQAHFYIFSDDITWCKAEYKDLMPTFIECNKKNKSWRDMLLMSLCTNHINANSTFSWWGAWLSTKNGITICPTEFIHNVVTRDIYPETWVQL
ncbi:glycosyltransferase, family 11 [Segatella oris F0302]|uniref:Glycosyltransferase, family 11 n=1 Tax=Segatella oris F0302 TaxID=649760 RepID=D1QQ94_9BACT|nr:alpha-1,2-fucosyltransferase [Segatella oris]EFB32300.1 glycosyltransferase, family 11 [Segatella oris F0302]